MNWIFIGILVLGNATTVPVAFCQSETETREPLTGFKDQPPCVAASSPCPLEFKGLPETLESGLVEARKLFDAGNFAGSQAMLQAILVPQPDSKIILYDLPLPHLKHAHLPEPLLHQHQP